MPREPHEFQPAVSTACAHWDGKHFCTRPASDPIHQTNEVSDEYEPKRSDLAGQESSDDGSCRRCGDVSVGDGPRVSGGVPELADGDTGVVSDDSKGDGDAGVDSLPDLRSAVGPDRDPVQVTNYDAEAEARAREGEWVKPGDGVLYFGVAYRVTRRSPWPEDQDHIMLIHKALGFEERVHVNDLRTPTGQPVLGFREREAPLDGDRLVRIAALERERDEARAERDELLHAMPKSVMRRIKAQGWVRLDDATRDLVIRETKERLECGERPTWFGCLYEVLLDLRDGKLKEGE